MTNLQDLITLERTQFNMSNKRRSFTVLEYPGDKCIKCNQVMSIRSYFTPNESDFSANRELKKTIICGCGLKVILRNGVVFFNPDKHRDRHGSRATNNSASVALKPSTT